MDIITEKDKPVGPKADVGRGGEVFINDKITTSPKVGYCRA